MTHAAALAALLSGAAGLVQSDWALAVRAKEPQLEYPLNGGRPRVIANKGDAICIPGIGFSPQTFYDAEQGCIPKSNPRAVWRKPNNDGEMIFSLLDNSVVVINVRTLREVRVLSDDYHEGPGYFRRKKAKPEAGGEDSRK